MNPGPPPHGIISPLKDYDGTTNVNQWIDRFKIFVAFHQELDEPYHILSAIQHLKGAAYHWYFNVPQSQKDNPVIPWSSLEEFLTALCSEYGQVSDTLTAETDLHFLHQTGTIADYD
ncbi:hypothetical protein H4219_006399, partial [Mycoemilia scoparia]